RVRAALRAAILRPRGPFVATAFLAATERARAPRLRALACAWRASARGEAAARPSRRSTRSMARERRADGFCFARPRRSAACALRRVRADVFPLAGALRFTPERRAF